MRVLYFFDGNNKLEVVKMDKNLKPLREELMRQLNLLAKHELSNEFQPTMNCVDGFHFYVRESNGYESKRCFFIAPYYSSKRLSIFVRNNAIEVAQGKGLISKDTVDSYIELVNYNL